VSSSVGFEELRDIGHQWIIGVGIGKEGTNGKQDLGNGQGRTPLVLQNVQTDSTVRVDVAMVDASGKVNLWWFERVIGGKMNVEEKDSSGIWRIVGPHNGGLPVEHVISDGSGGTVCWRILSQVN
jgi:hypothetical protein